MTLTIIRSPRYPFINLRKAIERADQFYKEHDRHAVRAESAASAWGYAPTSSGFRQTIPALISYGLLQDSGSGSDRKLQLTEQAWRYLIDERSGVRDDLIKKFALAPKIMRELWSTWGAKPPGEAECRSYLRIEKNFAEGATQELVSMYKDNIAFAKLSESEKVQATPTVSQDQPGEQMEAVSSSAHSSSSSATTGALNIAPGETTLMLYNNRIRISADVDLDGAKELIRKLQKRIELLEEEQ